MPDDETATHVEVMKPTGTRNRSRRRPSKPRSGFVRWTFGVVLALFAAGMGVCAWNASSISLAVNQSAIVASLLSMLHPGFHAVRDALVLHR